MLPQPSPEGWLDSTESCWNQLRLGVVAIVFALIGGLCSTLSLEGLDLVNSLPKYRDNIHARWAAIQRGPPGPLSLALSGIQPVNVWFG
jgi:hypothetical protein